LPEPNHYRTIDAGYNRAVKRKKDKNFIADQSVNEHNTGLSYKG
jgi:hypothetical protein